MFWQRCSGKIENETGVNGESARRNLKKHKYRSYNCDIHQDLNEADQQKILNFYKQILQKEINAPNFQHRIVYSDESSFTNNECSDRNNFRYWTEKRNIPRKIWLTLECQERFVRNKNSCLLVQDIMKNNINYTF